MNPWRTEGFKPSSALVSKASEPSRISSRELLARLRAAVRRAGWVGENAAAPQVGEVVAGRLRISVDTHSAALGDQPLVLTPTEFGLLLALLRAKGRVKSRAPDRSGTTFPCRCASPTTGAATPLRRLVKCRSPKACHARICSSSNRQSRSARAWNPFQRPSVDGRAG